MISFFFAAQIVRGGSTSDFQRLKKEGKRMHTQISVGRYCHKSSEQFVGRVEKNRCTRGMKGSSPLLSFLSQDDTFVVVIAAACTFLLLTP